MDQPAPLTALPQVTLLKIIRILGSIFDLVALACVCQELKELIANRRNKCFAPNSTIIFEAEDVYGEDTIRLEIDTTLNQLHVLMDADHPALPSFIQILLLGNLPTTRIEHVDWLSASMAREFIAHSTRVEMDFPLNRRAVTRYVLDSERCTELSVPLSILNYFMISNLHFPNVESLDLMCDVPFVEGRVVSRADLSKNDAELFDTNLFAYTKVRRIVLATDLIEQDLNAINLFQQMYMFTSAISFDTTSIQAANNTGVIRLPSISELSATDSILPNLKFEYAFNSLEKVSLKIVHGQIGNLRELGRKDYRSGDYFGLPPKLKRIDIRALVQFDFDTILGSLAGLDVLRVLPRGDDDEEMAGAGPLVFDVEIVIPLMEMGEVDLSVFDECETKLRDDLVDLPFLVGADVRVRCSRVVGMNHGF